MGSFRNKGPFLGSLLYIRVPYFIGDLKRDPKLEKYLCPETLHFILWCSLGSMGLRGCVQEHRVLWTLEAILGDQNWVLVRGLDLSYHKRETILFIIDPYYGNLN